MRPGGYKQDTRSGFHPEFQQIDTDTGGEFQEKRLAHREEAEGVLSHSLATVDQQVRIGMEAGGHAHWFARLAELQLELWIGDAAQIRTKSSVQTEDGSASCTADSETHVKDDFPQIWVPSWENRDSAALLWHRHRMVQARTRIMNQVQAVALNDGLRCKRRLWREHGTEATGVIPVGAVGKPATARSAGVAGSTESTIAERSQAIEHEEVENSPTRSD